MSSLAKALATLAQDDALLVKLAEGYNLSVDLVTAMRHNMGNAEMVLGTTQLIELLTKNEVFKVCDPHFLFFLAFFLVCFYKYIDS